MYMCVGVVRERRERRVPNMSALSFLAKKKIYFFLFFLFGYFFTLKKKEKGKKTRLDCIFVLYTKKKVQKTKLVQIYL